jgi:hypothetical protein
MRIPNVAAMRASWAERYTLPLSTFCAQFESVASHKACDHSAQASPATRHIIAASERVEPRQERGISAPWCSTLEALGEDRRRTGLERDLFRSHADLRVPVCGVETDVP